MAVFTFGTVHTAIPLEILVIKRTYELFYAIWLHCRIMLTQIILLNPYLFVFPYFIGVPFGMDATHYQG